MYLNYIIIFSHENDNTLTLAQKTARKRACKGAKTLPVLTSEFRKRSDFSLMLTSKAMAGSNKVLTWLDVKRDICSNQTH